MHTFYSSVVAANHFTTPNGTGAKQRSNAALAHVHGNLHVYTYATSTVTVCIMCTGNGANVAY